MKIKSNEVDGVTVLEWWDRTYKLHEGGKIEVLPLCSVGDAHDLAMAYTPGVARVCMSIHENKALAHEYTIKKNTVAIVSDGTAGFHVSFDVDGCDPTVIPGSGTLVPGGVSFREAHLLMEYVADSAHLLSMEIVELNPFLDERNISARRALELVLSAMGKSIL